RIRDEPLVSGRAGRPRARWIWTAGLGPTAHAPRGVSRSGLFLGLLRGLGLDLLAWRAGTVRVPAFVADAALDGAALVVVVLDGDMLMGAAFFVGACRRAHAHRDQGEEREDELQLLHGILLVVDSGWTVRSKRPAWNSALAFAWLHTAPLAGRRSGRD